jgi:protein-tyrosine phosphatase
MRRPHLSDIRNFVDRRLHKRRRAAALKQLQERARPGSFLFICYGNVCRSPYAAKAFEQLIRSRGLEYDRIDSAGFVGPGRPTPSEGVVVASARNIDLRDHISKVFTFEMIRGHDLIVVMDSSQRKGLISRFGADDHILILGDLDPMPIETRTIFDPWKSSSAGFERSYDRIDRCLNELLNVLERSTVRVAASAQA